MVTKLTIEDIQRTYALLKQKATEHYMHRQYVYAWNVMCDAVKLIQTFNWEYTDDDLEKLLQQLAAQWIPNKTNKYVSNENRVVVLDDWCTSYVLVLQYIDALVAAGCEILYISSKDINNTRHKNIIPNISKYPQLTYLILPANESSIDEWSRNIYDKIIAFHPAKVIAHISTYSAFLPVIARLPEALLTYRSNLDDQCFWLGCSVIDYTLEFRPFGVAVSRERRNIRPEQQLYVPFYPIIDGNPFEGFPELPTDSVILFSGGDFYKTLNPKYTYWNLVRRVLHENPKAVLLFATKNGLREQQDFLTSFIRINHLEKQFFYIGFRSDINEVFAHSDIFLGTCPVCGSLSSQLAAMNHKPILQYYLPDTDDDETEQALNYNNPELHISFYDEASFLEEAKRLIDDVSYRKQKGEIVYQSTIKPEQFNRIFIEAITTNYAPCPTKQVNYQEVSNRWWWPEQMGFEDNLSYVVSILKRNSMLYKQPSVWLKYNYRRWIVQKMLNIAWYKYKLRIE